MIPAYNEERRLPATLDAILSYLRRKEFSNTEILVVNDGSVDGTADLVRERSKGLDIPLRLLENPGNRGKGYSVRCGMREATGEWVLFTDADLSAPIEECDKLLKRAVEGRADVAIGSRALDRSLIGARQPALREYSGRFFNLIMRFMTGLPYADTQCGLKLFHCAAARRIFALQQLDGFSFDVEDLVIAETLGLKVIEVPVRWNNAAGTKVNTIQGLKAFSDLLKIRGYAIRGLYRSTQEGTVPQDGNARKTGTHT